MINLQEIKIFNAKCTKVFVLMEKVLKLVCSQSGPNFSGPNLTQKKQKNENWGRNVQKVYTIPAPMFFKNIISINVFFLYLKLISSRSRPVSP